MLNCFDVAKYFLAMWDEESDPITNLKLQRLAYYAQSASLGFHDVPLFPESIVAWPQGPVVPELYHAYESFGDAPLPKTESLDLGIYSEDERKLMDDVYTFFGQFTAPKMRKMTHEEAPWTESSPTGAVISPVSMRDSFRETWGDQMLAAVSDPDTSLADLMSIHWKPSPATLEAVRRYKKGRAEGDNITYKQLTAALSSLGFKAKTKDSVAVYQNEDRDALIILPIENSESLVRHSNLVAARETVIRKCITSKEDFDRILLLSRED